MKTILLALAIIGLTPTAGHAEDFILGKMKGELPHEFVRKDADGNETKYSGVCKVAANISLNEALFDLEFSAWECGGMNVFNEGFGLILENGKSFWRKRDGSKGAEVGTVSADGKTVTANIVRTKNETVTIYKTTCGYSTILKKTFDLTTVFTFEFVKISDTEFHISRKVTYQNIYPIQIRERGCGNSWTDYARGDNLETAIGSVKE